MTRRRYAELVPGDTFLRATGDGELHTVTVLERRPASYVDRFGRTLDALYCEADGRTGLVPYGPGGTCETEPPAPIPLAPRARRPERPERPEQS